MDDNIYTYIIDLKSSVPEMVVSNPDGTYSIFLNARYSFERQQESFKHACKHIQNNDFEKTDVQTIETEAHKKDAPKLRRKEASPNAQP
jgi:hypothetical protein